MANFVLLYSGGAMGASEAEQAEIMQAWGVWFENLGSSLVDGGNPFTPTAKKIESNGTVSDVSASSLATGYSIIQADSFSDAVEKAKGCPNLRGGQVTVYETFPVM